MEKRTGSCHCKAVKYEVEIDLAKPVIECNCSHCEAKGLLLAFVPGDKLSITEGEDHLTEYRFSTGKIRHTFCMTCGVQCFGQGEGSDGPTAAINVRTIDGVDLTTLTRMPYDGKAF
jgi:hypothetical protein